MIVTSHFFIDAENENEIVTSILYYCSILSGPLLACVCGSFITLIPIHNVLEQPNYWYEDIICRFLSCGVIIACQLAIRAESWSNFSFKNRLITYIWLIVIGHIVGPCTYAVHFYIWIIHFGFSQPIALGHFVMGTSLVLSINVAIYFRYEYNFIQYLQFSPHENVIFYCSSLSETDKPNIKTRYAWFLSQILVLIFFVWGYGVFGSAFTNAPSEYQWILAFVAPFVQDLFKKTLYKVACKSAGEGSQTNKSIKFLVQHYVISRHAVFMAVIVGGVATSTTSYCIMAVDFCTEMQKGWIIIKKFRNDPNSFRSEIEGMY